jgi:hypothetical protein
MLTRQKLIVLLTLVLFAAPASAGILVYVVNGEQFGSVDLGTGAFNPIGPGTPQGADGLVPGPNGSLFTLTFSGDLDSINPATGVLSRIGATGLADCSTLTSPCGPTSSDAIAALGGTIYATDFNNDLYTVNPLTGAATLIGATGIPAVTFIPDATIPGGDTFDGFDESLFSAGGNLYATFDTINIEPNPFTVTPIISPDLYEINPLTGHATLIGPTTLTLGAAVNVDGTIYAFENMNSQVLALDVANGGTSFVSNFDPAAGIIDGAAQTPEPASIMLVGIGVATAAIVRRRRRRV